MIYHRALKIAQSVLVELLPWCKDIEIAGSLRRHCDRCGDIDFVILASDREAILQRIRKSCAIRTGDSTTALNTIAFLEPKDRPPLQLDFFFATDEQRDLLDVTPSNWGSLLLCRTGSMQHNIQLAARAKKMGLHWNPYKGVFKGDKLIASATEESIYQAVGLEWRAPIYRENL